MTAKKATKATTKTQNKQRPVFWITGNYYQCRQCWNQLLEMWKDPLVEILDCGEGYKTSPSISTAGDIIALLKNRDMFDTRPRVIKVKGLPEGYKLLTDYLHLVNSQNVLVIDGPIGHRAKPPSTKFVTAKTSAFFKAVKAMGKVLEYDTDAKDSAAAIQWVKKLAGDFNRKIENDAAQLLVEHRGLNLDRLYADIIALKDYQTDKITVDDVKEMCIPIFLQTVWDLCDALDQEDADLALGHLQRLYVALDAEVKSRFFEEVQSVFSALYYHFEFINNLIHSRVSSPNQAQEAFKILKKKGPKKEWDTEKYSSGLLWVSLQKSGVQRLLKRWDKNKASEVLLDLGRSWSQTRRNYDCDVAKLCLDSFVLLACGKISLDDSANIKGWRNSVEKMRLQLCSG